MYNWLCASHIHRALNPPMWNPQIRKFHCPHTLYSYIRDSNSCGFGYLEPVPHGYQRVTVYNKNSKVNKIAFLHLDTPYFIYISLKKFLRWKWAISCTDFHHLYWGSLVYPCLIKHMLTGISAGEEIYHLARLARLPVPSVQWPVPGGERDRDLVTHWTR